jgi:uncharacterized protein
MFGLIGVIGFGLAVLLIAAGVARANQRGRVGGGVALAGAGVVVAVLVGGGLWFLDLWGEYLWYRAEGYGDRFLTMFWAGWSLTGAGALAVGGTAWVITWLARSPRVLQVVATALGMVIGGTALGSAENEWLLFRNAAPSGTVDPILGRDVSFYFFELPFYQTVAGLLILGVLLGGAAAVLTAVLRSGETELSKVPALERLASRDPALRAAPNRALLVAGGLLLALLAVHGYLVRYAYIVEGTGVAAGAGYTDVAFRLPGILVASVVVGLLGATLAVLGLLARDVARSKAVAMLGAAGVLSLAVWILATALIPALPQRFHVAPNELAVEASYIRHSMRGTREAFGLLAVEERRPTEVAALTGEIVELNRDILREVPLWDYRALLKVFGQLQRMRPYYELPDVDIDRYVVNGEYRQVMISAREMNQEGLPAQSRTFVNTRFKYTHGYGVVAVPVNEFSGTGAPTWWARDIPAASPLPEFALTRPEIYFGELTVPHVYVRTAEPEFHYPAGEQNAETFYEGAAGVPLDNLLARLAYAKRFDGSRVFTSRYLTPESRILFRRQILERVTAITPFLAFDEDPYIVVSEGRLFWILDGYTFSRRYPYSEPIPVGGVRVNYFRNPVKAVVDAYEGTVRYYVFDETDVIVQTWSRVFPGMFRPAAEMPEGLRAHVRYPELLLHTQGRVYAKYHMEDLGVFYNQEDLWTPATEVYYGQEQAVEPYYTLWRTPEAEQLEFVLKWPFTTRGRHLLAGWLAGRSDGEHYGKLIAYKLPKDRQVPGPQQFEAKIDSDPELSNTLLAWNRAGSRVVRGHVLTIPIGGSILHVEPIYLESERASMPELQLVAVMQGENFASGRTLDDAIRRLLGRTGGGRTEGQLAATATGAAAAASALTPGADGGAPLSFEESGRRANEAFQNYLRFQAEGRFDEAAQELKALQAHLNRLAGGS